MRTSPVTEEIASFASALQQVYAGQSWDAVAPFAQRAWEKIEHIGGQDWARVHQVLRETWTDLNQ